MIHTDGKPTIAHRKTPIKPYRFRAQIAKGPVLAKTGRYAQK